MEIYMDEEIAGITKLLPSRKNWTKKDMSEIMSMVYFTSPPHIQEFYRKKAEKKGKKAVPAA